MARAEQGRPLGLAKGWVMLEPSRERRRFTPGEYLALEDSAETRSEYCDGEIFAMTGGTLRHNRIINNIARHLGNALSGGPCQVYTSDVRLFIDRHRLYTYPDLMVLCGPPPLLAGREDTVVDAALIIEVLSPSTEVYDRGEKFRFYRALPSLQQYILVSQDRPQVEQFPRVGEHDFLLSDQLTVDGAVAIPSLKLDLRLDAIYEGVDWNSTQG